MADTQSTESIRSLIVRVDAETVVLPEFQRDFVWDLPKTYDLLDSLVREIFIGSIIYGIPSFEVTSRKIDDRPRKGKGSRKKLELKSYAKADIDRLVQTGDFRMILDGQQRTTALYRALRGHDEVWFLAIPDGELFEHDESSLKLEEVLYEFAGEQSPERLSIRVSDVYSMMEGGLRREAEKLELLKQSDYCAKNDIDEARFERLFSFYLTITEKLQDLFKADKLVSYYLLDTSIDKFSLFFERSNSKGIHLNFIDILAAKLYSGFNLRQKVLDFEDEHPGVGLNRDVVVRSISREASDGKEMGRAWILKNLSHTDFTEHWDTSISLYTKCLNFLQENRWIISRELMPYEAMLVPMMAFLRQTPSQEFSQITAVQLDFVRWWYWSSIFSQRYASRTITIMTEDARVLSGIATNNPKLESNYRKRFVPALQSSSDILELKNPGSAVFKGVLSLVAMESEGLVDWSNGRIISPNEKIDNHHIFPREYLSKVYGGNEDDVEYVDSLANRTLIPRITNIRIGKRKPSDYMKELMTKNGELTQALGKHLVPSEIVDGSLDDDFESFLKKRSEDLYRLVERETVTAAAGALQPFTSPHP